MREIVDRAGHRGGIVQIADVPGTYALSGASVKRMGVLILAVRSLQRSGNFAVASPAGHQEIALGGS
jgi:hypothetical protein